MKTRLCRKTDPHWQAQPPSCGAYRSWLLDKGSLTRRLQANCKRFEVRRVRYTWARPLPDEMVLLGLRRGMSAWIREVWLQDGEQPLVFARSVLPRSSLRGAWRGLGRLGARPLGAALFADAHVVRSPLAYRKLHPRHAILGNVLLQKPLWARRSVFMREGRAILVTEVFLPAVLKL